MLAEVDKAFQSAMADPTVRYSAALCAGPSQLIGNPTMFQEASKNLLNNALMHGGDRLKHVRLIASVTSDKLVVEVQDDGTGIAPADFQNALGRFSQIGPSAGSGLGLPIAKAVDEDFGGTLHIKKTDALFSVVLVFPLSGVGLEPAAPS